MALSIDTNLASIGQRLARSVLVLGATASLAACGQPEGGANQTLVSNDSASVGNALSTVENGGSVPSSQPSGATPQQQAWLRQATAFMARPEQQRDVLTALRARAATNPAFCPAATFAPARIDIAFEPEPRFAADGTMTQGEIVQRFTMQGCAAPLLLSVTTKAAPGMPLRFVALLPGTTFTDMALQEQAIPQAIAAARPLLAGCSSIGPIDTRLIGGRPDAGGALVPWSEYWLVAGCGTLVSVKLRFTPDPQARRMGIVAYPKDASVVRRGMGAPAAAGDKASPAPMRGAATGTSVIPAGGAPIPGAKVAGTCLFKLREATPASAPENAECPTNLPAASGAAIACTATRGDERAAMSVAVTRLDTAVGSLEFRCTLGAP